MSRSDRAVSDLCPTSQQVGDVFGFAIKAVPYLPTYPTSRPCAHGRAHARTRAQVSLGMTRREVGDHKDWRGIPIPYLSKTVGEGRTP